MTTEEIRDYMLSELADQEKRAQAAYKEWFDAKTEMQVYNAHKCLVSERDKHGYIWMICNDLGFTAV